MSPALRAILTRPFSPSHISGIVAWWDASDAASVWADTNGTPTAAGGLVRCWKDKVSGIAADQATGSYQPTLVTGGIGARSIQFAGLHALDVPAIAPVRFACIVHRTNVGTRAALVASFNGANNTNFEVHTSGGGIARFYYKGDLGWSASIHSTGNAVVSTWVTGEISVAAGWGFYKNGVADGSVVAAGSDAISSTWRIGADKRASDPAGAIPLTGYLAEIVLCSRTPSAAQLAQLHAYLLRKWGVTV